MMSARRARQDRRSCETRQNHPVSDPTKKDVKINEPPILFKKTRVLIGSIESRLDAPLLTDWSSRNGSVCHNDVAAFYEMLKHELTKGGKTWHSRFHIR